jgi:hypothetical protein
MITGEEGVGGFNGSPAVAKFSLSRDPKTKNIEFLALRGCPFGVYDDRIKKDPELSSMI